jgi:hypothetical protein
MSGPEGGLGRWDEVGDEEPLLESVEVYQVEDTKPDEAGILPSPQESESTENHSRV